MADIFLAQASPWTELKRGRFGRTESDAGVSIIESAAVAMGLLSQRKGAGADLFRATSSLGLTLPTVPKWTEAQRLKVLWAGPGQWLLRRTGSFGDIEADVSSLAPYATLIDQSDSRATLTLSGPRVRAVLAKGFEIDLHQRAFKPGDLAMTAAGGISALLWQIDERPTYEIAVPRSMANSFWEWLAESAAEFGYRVGEGV